MWVASYLYESCSLTTLLDPSVDITIAHWINWNSIEYSNTLSHFVWNCANDAFEIEWREKNEEKSWLRVFAQHKEHINCRKLQSECCERMCGKLLPILNLKQRRRRTKKRNRILGVVPQSDQNDMWAAHTFFCLLQWVCACVCVRVPLRICILTFLLFFHCKWEDTTIIWDMLRLNSILSSVPMAIKSTNIRKNVLSIFFRSHSFHGFQFSFHLMTLYSEKFRAFRRHFKD